MATLVASAILTIDSSLLIDKKKDLHLLWSTSRSLLISIFGNLWYSFDVHHNHLDKFIENHGCRKVVGTDT